MEHLHINTAQNVALEYEIAGVGDRILATMIDALITGVYIAVLFFTILETFPSGYSGLRNFLMIAALVPFVFYHFLCEVFLNGQSFGKKILNIRVIKIDGSQPGAGDYFIRWLLRIFDVTISSGVVALVTILVNGKGQRLGDIAANTTVVKLRRRVNLNDTMYTVLEDDYQPSFPQVMRLSDSDVTVIKEVLELNRRQNAQETLMQLDAHLRKVLEVNPQLTPDQFVMTVLKDYNYYTGRV